MKLADCFLFSGLGAELDLLEIRLTELDPIVDRFVIVESNTTFTGHFKPLVFMQHAERFSPWLKKISYQSITADDVQGLGAWEAEAYSRNQFILGLEDFSVNDKIIVSDLDEIPSAIAVTRHLEYQGISTFSMPLYYYWLNCLTAHLQTYSVMGSMADLAQLGGQAMRRYSTPIRVINNGGWHFSCLGGPIALSEKLQSFSHTELNCEPYVNPIYLSGCMTAPVDFLHRPEYAMQFVPIDHTWPQAITTNRTKYAHLEYPL